MLIAESFENLARFLYQPLWILSSGSGLFNWIITMKAFELYILDLFLNIQKHFPSSCHSQVLAQIRQVYAPVHWSLMSPEAQYHYFDLESKTRGQFTSQIYLSFFLLEKTNEAATRNMVVFPIQSDHEKLKMVCFFIKICLRFHINAVSVWTGLRPSHGFSSTRKIVSSGCSEGRKGA